jgi:hypothetical protein
LKEGKKHMISTVSGSTKRECLSKLASRAIVPAVAVFVVLIAFAMRAYPGGTAWDPTTRGHDFWFNYLCDLARKTALNGAPNALGAQITQVALFVLGTGAFSFWWSVPLLFVERTLLARAVRVCGAISCSGMVLVALLPSDRFGSLHPILLAMAGGPGLAAGTCALFGLAARERFAAIVGASAVITCAIDFGLYAQQIAGDGPGPIAVVVMERVSLVLILAWMCVSARRLTAIS